MTIEEIEFACDAGRPLDFSRHPLDMPDLPIHGTFHPLGFPVELRTNSAAILSQARELWSVFEPRFNTRPIQVDVQVLPDNSENRSSACPPVPETRIMQSLLVSVADANNYSVAELDKLSTRITISRGTLRHKNYLGYFFLGAGPLCHIASIYTTPVHAGCVALESHGLLLCGDSGAGKSSLSYACARAGWTYVTDDASLLLNSDFNRELNPSDLGASGRRVVTGNCHQVRFRPSAARLFPEVEDFKVTPRATGKPSVELPTALLRETICADMVCAPTAEVDYLVFLNRRAPGKPELRPYRKDVARYFLRQVMYGPRQSLALQYAEAERLLTADVFELRYSCLDWAVDRLETLVRSGC